LKRFEFDRSDGAPKFETMKYVLDNHYLLLLTSLMLTLCAAPAFGAHTQAGKLLHIASLTSVFLTGVYANRGRRKAFRLGVVMTVIAVPAIWACITTEIPYSITGSVIAIVYCLVMATLILISVFDASHLNPHSLFGAISSYLLVGLAWALMYQVIAQLQPEALRQASLDGTVYITKTSPFADYVYFSFVTMSTLGFGDIAPVTRAARTAAWVQSVVGQFFLAVLVARLVGALPYQRRETNTPA